MMIRNLFPNARAARKLSTWNGTASQAADGIRWTYTLKEGQSNGTVTFGSTATVGRVIVVMTDNPDSYKNGVENATTLEKNDEYIAAVSRSDHTKSISLVNGPVTILAVAVYESESVWNRVKTLYEAVEIPSPCISWDWMPLP